MSSIASSSRSTITTIASTSLRSSARVPTPIRTFSSSSSRLGSNYYNAWRAKAHRKPPPSLPPPLPPLFKQTVSLADGSIIYMHSTSPTPQIIRLTRDVTNNPVWSPGSKARGLDEDMEGAVGRFRRRFEGMDLGGAASPRPAPADGVGESAADKGAASPGPEGIANMAWMSEGGREEVAPRIPEKKAAPTKGKKR